MSVPENLCRPLGEGELNNIISVTPSQQIIEGKRWVYLTIDIKKIVPYAIRQEGQNLLIDFNVSSLVEKKISNSPKIPQRKKWSPKSAWETAKNRDDVTKNEAKEVTPVKKETLKRYTDQIISLDFSRSRHKERFASNGGIR